MSLPWGGTWLSKERGRTHPHTHTHIPYRNVKMENILRPVRPGDIYGQLLCQLPLMAAPRPLFEALAGINLPRPLLPLPVARAVCPAFPLLYVFLALLLSHFHLFSFFLFWLRALCPIFYYIVWTICFLFLSHSHSPSLLTAIMNLGQLSGARLVYFFMQQLRFGFDDLRKTFTWGCYFTYFPCVRGGMYFPPYNYPLNIYKFLRTYFKLKSEKKSASSIDL